MRHLITTISLRKIALLVVTVIFSVASVSNTALALGGIFDENFYNNNDINFYGPNVCSTTNQAASTGLTIPQYSNPVINKNAPDPSVIQASDGTLHMYVSGLHHYTSTDGVKWDDKGDIKIAGKSLSGASGLWAPDIAKVNDMYVLSWAQPGDGIYYATSSSPGGGFEYGGKYSLGGKKGIDPQLFADGGKFYLYFAADNNIFVETVGVSGKTLNDGTPKSILNRLDVTNEDWTVEAPWVINRNGTYYLFYSTGKWDGGAGFSQDNYDLRVAKSTSPTAKFQRKGTPILTKTQKFTGPGTATTISDSAGNDWLYYHARPGGGSDRVAMLDPITYVGGWPVINGGNGPSTSYPGGSGATAATATAAGTTTSAAGSFRMGTYNAAGVTMQKGGLGGLSQAQQHFNAGIAVAESNNATVMALQEVATTVQAPSGWSIYKAPFGNRTVAIAWKTGVWVNVVEKGIFTVDNSKESPSTPDAYKYPYVTLADKNGTVITVVSAHLVSKIRNDVQRPEQAATVRDKVIQLSSGGRSVVLGGDFNERKPTIFDELNPLVPANPNYGGIDHIFGIPGTNFSNWKAVENTKSFTDHPLIFSDVAVTGKTFSATPTPSACVCSSGDSSTTSADLRGNTNLEKIYYYFIDKGLSPPQAAGIVGNIAQESGGNPLRAQVGPDTKDPSQFTTKGHAWGIIQWDPGSKVIDLAKQAAITDDISLLSTQLELVWWHMNNISPTGVKNMLADYKSTTDYKSATTMYEQKMEGAGKPDMQNRITAAKLALDSYNGTASTSPVAATTASGCANGESGAAAGNAVQTAINYAWPNQKVSPATKKKPAYDAAISKAKAAGKYTGDTCFGDGVDCGAFVTRVMQDSGLDPNYGGGGNTGVQLQYMLDHPALYKELKPSSTADLQPGDIAIQDNSSRHHTFIYVGKQAGFDSTIASASQCQHAPWAGSETPADPAFRWFRFIGGTNGGSA